MDNPWSAFVVSIIVLAITVFAILRLPRRLPGGPVVVPADSLDLARKMAGSARRRMFLSLGVGSVVFLVLCLYRLPESGEDLGWVPWYGIAQAVAPVVGGLAALAVLAIAPVPTWPAPDGVHVAGLARRGWRWSWSLAPIVVAVLALAAFAIATGISAAHFLDGDRAVSFAIVSGSYLVEGVPYPGWPYGLPVLIGSVLVVALLSVVLRRIDAAAASAPGALSGMDAAIRSTMARGATTTALVVVATSLGEFLWVTGATVSSTATVHKFVGPRPTVSSICESGCSRLVIVQPTFAFGIVEIGVGVLVIAFALLLLARTLAYGRRMVAIADVAPVAEKTPV